MSDQVANAAERLSSMADKVAGFAIGSYLLLIFACLKDINPWVQTDTFWFAIGTGVAGIVYIAAVWLLYYLELNIRAKALSSSELGLLNSVSLWLVLARSAGIAAFTLVGILAVIGARFGSGADYGSGAG